MPGPKELLTVLTEAMECADFWVAVHATEYMIDLGYREQAERNCTKRLLRYEEVPQQRIGLWRVQYQLASDADVKTWILDKLVAAYLTPDGLDRLHAAETLAKLRFCFRTLDQSTVRTDMQEGGAMGAFVTWGMSVACDWHGHDDPAHLIGLLDGDAEERRLAAYGLSFLAKPTAEQWRVLAGAALAETDEETKTYLLGAGYQLYDMGHPADEAIYGQLRTLLLARVHSNVKSAQMELCRALSSRSDPEGKAVLTQLVGSGNTDIRATAAYALLKQYINE